MLIALISLLGSASPAVAGHTAEISTGWQNTGATRGDKWLPAVQGSRKDVPLFAGWRYTGESRFYYAPFARLQYTNFWSVGGAGNLLGVDLGLGGVGVYLTDPMSDFEGGARVGEWFVPLEINVANLRIGFNMTPGSPTDDRVTDPDAHRDSVRERMANDVPVDHTIQRYPFGAYQYVTVAFPVRFSVWNMLTESIGAGFYMESTVGALEWPLNIDVAHGAYTYNIVWGASAHFF